MSNHFLGTLESYIASNASYKCSVIIIVPAIACSKSLSVFFTNDNTF